MKFISAKTQPYLIGIMVPAFAPTGSGCGFLQLSVCGLTPPTVWRHPQRSRRAHSLLGKAHVRPPRSRAAERWGFWDAAFLTQF
jgi:hypothetical protein